jgi:cold-inducible RNA-binding protein
MDYSCGTRRTDGLIFAGSIYGAPQNHSTPALILGIVQVQLFFSHVFGGFQLGTKLYVGNLSHNITKKELEQMFAAHGTVTSAQVITDRETGRSKGFGFVEMGSDRQAQAAIAALNDKSVDGRNLKVNEARPQEGRSSGGFGGGRRGGSGRGGARY